jgi:hypothetical protein
MMPCSMTQLPELLATISMASRMGTPDESSVPSVRVKRATAIFFIVGPITGSCSSELVDGAMPPAASSQFLKP